MPQFSSRSSNAASARSSVSALYTSFKSVINGFRSFVRDKFRRITDLMHNASLNLCLWEHCMNGITKSSQSIDRYDHDVFYTPIFYLIKDREPVFCTFIPSYPHTKNFTFSIQFNTYGNINCFLYRSIIFPNMKMYCIHENNGIFSFSWTILPFFCNRQDSICHM